MAHITFIHGILNKPPADELLQSWRDALARAGGLDLGAMEITSSMVYWADVLYASPTNADLEGVLEGMTEGPVDLEGLEEGIDLRPEGADEKAFVESLGRRFGLEGEDEEGVEPAPSPEAFEDRSESPPADGEEALEGIPLPGFVKKRLMRVLLRDVHHYLFNTEHSPRPDVTYRVQDEIRRRVLSDLEANRPDDGRHLIVSHSMGTVIAYDCLKRAVNCPGVRGLMTVGSPLGLDEIQEAMEPEYSRRDGFPSQRLDGDWTNVYDSWDVVAAFDPRIRNDYERQGAGVVQDVSQSNGGWWRHDLGKYFAHGTLRRTLREQLAGLGR